MAARFDSEHRCRFENQRALQIQGLTQEQAVGRRLADTLAADDYALYARSILVVLAGQRVALEGVGMCDGKPEHYLVTLVPERDHQFAGSSFKNRTRPPRDHPGVPPP